MKQYCRYCNGLVTGNGIYCEKQERTISEGYAKRPNNCPDFEFNELDAFVENPNPYRPREPKAAVEDDGSQMTLF